MTLIVAKCINTMKIDPYHHQERYLKWKEEVKNGIPEVTPQNSEIILNYVTDMEKGLNVASVSVKGARSHIRLNTLREKMINFSKRFQEAYGLNKLTDITEDQAINFFADMRNGNIKTVHGKTFRSVETHARTFKAFWHWHQKISKKKGIEVPDITADLDTRSDKPDWVYLTEKEVKQLCDNAKPEYKMLIMFLFDTGIRSPTELMNVRVSDLYNDCKELNIREEASKTFGRRIKLMLCSDMLKEYIGNMKFTSDDCLFPIGPFTTNKYLKRLVVRVLGDRKTPAGGKTSELTMYDFRHISCCYWLPRYKSESALKYRFGWKKSDKIHYYSELLGMKDTISEEDMLIDLTKTEIEKRLEKSDKEKEMLSEKVNSLQNEVTELKAYVLEAHKKYLEVRNDKEIIQIKNC